MEKDLEFRWELAEGGGRLTDADTEIVTYCAPDEPGLTRLRLRATQGEKTCTAEAICTVTDALLPAAGGRHGPHKGLPGYTFRHAPGKLWRSHFDEDKNIVVINNGHRDFVFAAQQPGRKLRYICRLFTKELVIYNFPGLSADQLLERLIELSLFTEENLR